MISPALAIRTLAGLLLCLGAALLPVVQTGSRDALSGAAWTAVAVAALAAAGAAVRLTLDRYGVRLRALASEPAWLDVLVGWLISTLGVYVWSFALKRIAHIELVPSRLFGVVMLVLVAGLLVRRVRGLHGRPSAKALQRVWSRYLTGLAVLVFGVVLVGAPHFGVLHGYSTDPDQHIGWTNEVWRQGLLPDHYLHARTLIAYPLAFQALAFAFRGVTPLPPAAAVNLLPVVASTLTLFVTTAAAVALQSRGRVHRLRERCVVWVLAAALSAVFSSVQFSLWNFYEGTGRLASGPLTLVPMLALTAALWMRTRQPRLRIASVTRVVAIAVVAIFASNALLFALNPTYLLLEGLLSATALVALVAARWRMGSTWRGVTLGGAVGMLALSAVLLADPYIYRPIAKQMGWFSESDSYLARRQQDFARLLPTQSCLDLSCAAAALERTNLAAAAFKPVSVVLLGSIERLRDGTSPITSQAAEQPRWPFPDVSGSAVAPVHGEVPVALLMLIPGAFLVLAPWRSRSLLLMSALLFALAGIDAAVRAFLGQMIHPLDATLRLIPAYTGRASAVFFTQTVWAILLAGVLLCTRPRGTRPQVAWAASWLVALAVVGVGAGADLSARAEAVDVVDVGVTSDDLAAAAALETRYVPPSESYLVPAQLAVINGERWILPSVGRTVPLYLQAGRARLFLYFLSHSARYSPADYEHVCERLSARAPLPPLLRATRARWLLAFTEPGEAPEEPLDRAELCGRPMAELFPRARQIQTDGRVVLYRLW